MCKALVSQFTAFSKPDLILLILWKLEGSEGNLKVNFIVEREAIWFNT